MTPPPNNANRSSPGPGGAGGGVDVGERVLQVATASGSIYRIDTKTWYLTRFHPHTDDDSSVPLRRDGEALRLISILRLEVGTGAVFVIEPLGGLEVAFTTRCTSTVTAIQDWPEPLQAEPSGD